MPAITFKIVHRDRCTSARVGRVTTPHGAFDTPAFIPVGTQGAIKGLLPGQVAGPTVGAQVILANTYHLLLRPGADLIERMGGLHEWMRWGGPMLTDSGGYQVFSLANIAEITDDGVRFCSHLDGAIVDLTPKLSIQLQNQLGADIIMAFDDCPPAVGCPVPVRSCSTAKNGPGSDPRRAGRLRVQKAAERTVRWLDDCVQAHERADEQALFGIVQGGLDLQLRSWCGQRVTGHDLPGFAIGGVAVGESHEQIKQLVEHTAALLPADRPRYLMGVGYERDMFEAVRAGVDMFDCVLPTRNGRNASAFTATGRIRLRNAKYRDDPRVIDPGCDCPACGGPWPLRAADPGPEGAKIGRSGALTGQQQTPPPDSAGFSRSYIRHLFLASEMLGPVLVSLHNLRHFQRYLLDIREAIAQNDWSSFVRQWPVALATGSEEPLASP